MRLTADQKLTPERAHRWSRLLSGQHPVPIAVTPRDEVFRRDRLAVYRYRRDTPAEYSTPILLVYSLINRPSVLDLRPGRSVVEHLLSRGFDVYLLDWGIPDGLDRHAGLEIHVDLLLRTVVRQVCRHAGVAQVTLLGYCMGGTLTAMYAALHPGRVANLVLLGAPMHFRSCQRLYQWGTDPEMLDPETLVEACGNAPAWAFEGFSLLAAGQKLVRQASLYDNLDRPDFVETYLAMEQWVGDNVPVAGRMYAEFIKLCWHENRLIEGRLEIGGRTVRLERIAAPTLIIVGESDHLVPPETSVPSADVIPDAEVLRFPSGHIGLSVSSKSHLHLWPQVCDWLGARSGHKDPLQEAYA